MVDKKEHLHGLEVLRFLLGVYIILYHTFHFPELNDFINRTISMGFIGSSTFFILSGFILSYVYLKGNGTDVVHLKETPKSFFSKRFANLYPIHIFSLLLAIGIIWLVAWLNIQPNDFKTSNRFVMYDSNNYSPGNLLAHMMTDWEVAGRFILNIFLLQAWDPWFISFNAPSWSISVLLFMYLVFPYLAPKLSMVKRPFLALLIINIIYLAFPVVFSLTGLFDKPFTGILNRNPIVRLPEFLAGIMLCNIYFHLKKKNFILKNYYKIVMIFFIFISFAASIYLLKHPEIFTDKGNVSYYLLHTGLLLIPECCLVYLFTTFNIKKPDNITMWKKLGGATLPMFALHLPLYMLFLRIETLLVGSHPIWLYPVFVFLTILACVYFQEYIVVKTRKLILKLILKKDNEKIV